MSLKFRKDLDQLIRKYVDGKASAEEIKFIENYYQHFDRQPDVLNGADQDELLSIEIHNLDVIKKNIHADKSRYRKLSPYYYAAAALVLVCLGLGVWSLTRQVSRQQQLSKSNARPLDVMPGTEGAVLVLANGKKVVLDASSREKTIYQDQSGISTTKDGQLTYRSTGSGEMTQEVAFLQLQTAKGNQYQLMLPDGTKVWLNAASSLKFPEVFKGRDRKVELSGEGYFEVAKDRDHPFIVKTVKDGTSQEVKVLGTHFNINSYMDDHQIKTTLLEGSVQVDNLRSVQVLKPGDQSQLNSKQINVTTVDVEDEIAWKNGLFRFDQSALKDILYQLERWYDIKVDYNSLPNKRFSGMVPRKAKLSEVLKMLSLTGNIHFNIEEGKRLTVHQQ